MDSKLVGNTEKRVPPNAGKGRPPGSVNKTTAAVKEMLLAAFDDMGGLEGLTEWGKENRTQFYQIWAKLLPQEIKGEIGVRDDITPEERLARATALLDAARARRAGDAGDAAE